MEEHLFASMSVCQTQGTRTIVQKYIFLFISDILCAVNRVQICLVVVNALETMLIYSILSIYYATSNLRALMAAMAPILLD